MHNLTMTKLTCALLACLWTVAAYPADDIQPSANAASTELVIPDAPDSGQMEKDLQHLNWKQFRSVVEAVPKLKADVDAYGPLGWQYVQANYKDYGWKKSIDRLDDSQKQQLAELIQSAKNAQ